MNVVLVGPFGLQPKGTVSVRALPLARALVERGHRATVLIPPWDDPPRAGLSWDEAGVRVVNLPLPGGVMRLPPLFHFALALSLARRALAVQPDVVHLFKPKAYAGLAHWLLYRWRQMTGARVRLVVDADDWEQAWNEVLPYSGLQKRFFAWQERWGLSHADTVTVASKALAELSAAAGVPRERVFYLPNGLPPDTPDPPPARRTEPGGTVLLYTRFAEFRLARIVSLVRLVGQEVPARWVIVGRGFRGEEAVLARQLAQAGLAEAVHFAGWPPDRPVEAYFAAADVAVHPYDDTLLNRTKCSVKLVQLLAAGLPVVADAVGQNCEYIQHGETGILVPPEDDQAFAAAVVSLLRSPARRQETGRAAARSVRRKYAWSALVQTAERAYH